MFTIQPFAWNGQLLAARKTIGEVSGLTSGLTEGQVKDFLSGAERLLAPAVAGSKRRTYRAGLTVAYHPETGKSVHPAGWLVTPDDSGEFDPANVVAAWSVKEKAPVFDGPVGSFTFAGAHVAALLLAGKSPVVKVAKVTVSATDQFVADAKAGGWTFTDADGKRTFARGDERVAVTMVATGRSVKTYDVTDAAGTVTTWGYKTLNKAKNISAILKGVAA